MEEIIDMMYESNIDINLTASVIKKLNTKEYYYFILLINY